MGFRFANAYSSISFFVPLLFCFFFCQTLSGHNNEFRFWETIILDECENHYRICTLKTKIGMRLKEQKIGVKFKTSCIKWVLNSMNALKLLCGGLPIVALRLHKSRVVCVCIIIYTHIAHHRRVWFALVVTTHIRHAKRHFFSCKNYVPMEIWLLLLLFCFRFLYFRFSQTIANVQYRPGREQYRDNLIFYVRLAQTDLKREYRQIGWKHECFLLWAHKLFEEDFFVGWMRRIKMGIL